MDSIIVEKYYVSALADAASNSIEGVLPVGSVTYRVFLSLKPGCNFQAIHGNSATSGGTHTLLINTTTSFFNNIDRGDSYANNISSSYLNDQTTALDSWLSAGAAAGGQLGILKSKDNGVANLLFPHNPANMLAQQNTALFGISLSDQDGMVTGNPMSTNCIGDAGVNAITVFGPTAQGTNSYSITNGAVSALGGATGPNADSTRVLIGQFTTNGILHFELNIQIGTPGGGAQNFVSSNPVGSEITIPSLIYSTLTTTISAPAAISTGSMAVISLNATGNGVIDSVEFFVDGTKVGTDPTFPYSYNWTATTVGTHTLTSIAIESDGMQTASPAVIITVTGPTVNITQPITAAIYKAGNVVTIAANAADTGGAIDSVVFFVDGLRIGRGLSAPYINSWTSTVGTHTLTAIAMDNNGAFDTSAAVIIIVNANIPPTVNITAPANTAIYKTGNVVTITANAADADGVIDSVAFFVDGLRIGRGLSAPYINSWTSTTGTHTLTAIATDNDGAHTTSAIVTIIVNANIPPTVNITTPINAATYTIGSVVTIAANAADTDGLIDSVVFFVDGLRIGRGLSAPYINSWTSTVGTHTLTAIATDNSGAYTSSAAVIITISSVTGISEIIASSSLFTVYPNPASNYITIEINAIVQSNNVSYAVYDVVGNVLLNKKVGNIIGTYKELIDISSFSKGFYVIKMLTDELTVTKKIIIN